MPFVMGTWTIAGQLCLSHIARQFEAVFRIIEGHDIPQPAENPFRLGNAWYPKKVAFPPYQACAIRYGTPYQMAFMIQIDNLAALFFIKLAIIYLEIVVSLPQAAGAFGLFS